ncbi:MAG: 1-(5-phosphoribosyl)-5-amino-4-imidazole-carboxylate carboxylase [Isosphaeraceae bacterium]|jgi:NCAIR mutase (PurE)-related protein|nr:MAG: 1-(5-phosphoribosyl)-5-amino-4-imidazole-carboxylate carboxylase [Isosphaeraceae bacterium]
MDAHELRQLLEAYRGGAFQTEEVVRRLQTAVPFEETGDYAIVDTHRRLRCGFPEVVFGLGKTTEQLVAILGTLRKHGEGALATRVGPETAAALERAYPEGHYNRIGRTFRIPPAQDPGPRVGRVVIVTAGTSDLPVAEEARATADAWHCDVSLISDVGVAGIHRLFGKLDQLHGADCLVVVAGMEAALPSVVGGLVDCPIIAVPTSIGYGAHFHGLTSLLGMLNSCASNVVVTNIDAGFNGGHVAGLIARRAGLARLQAERARPND